MNKALRNAHRSHRVPSWQAVERGPLKRCHRPFTVLWTALQAAILVFGLTGVAFPAEIASRDVWNKIAPYFKPPCEYAGDFGAYRSPLVFADGQPVKTAAEWQRRRQEIRQYWLDAIGHWPELLEKPVIETLETSRRENFTHKKVRIPVATQKTIDGYLLLPDGEGPFPAVIVVYYDAESGAGLNPKSALRDFGYQLTRRGFVTLSIGWPRDFTDAENPKRQTLSTLAYIAANCCNALAALAEVDPKRIGICGHSFGGKWALFAACLYDRFAAAAWSDPGIVFDEKRPNVNYWEPWYLGWEAQQQRKPGVPTASNPRTGPYKKLYEEGHDLHELHVLMAPRPFLVSGGAEDPPERWKALNHSVAVNRLLGYENRVAMTNRPGHSPTEQSNEQMYLFFQYFLGVKSP